MIVRSHLRGYKGPGELLRFVNDLDSRHITVEILGAAIGLCDSCELLDKKLNLLR